MNHQSSTDHTTTDLDGVVQRALHLWSEPLPAGSAALDAFREVYTDPVQVNGEPTGLDVLVARARMLQGAITGRRNDIHILIVTPGRRAFSFSISGRHTGPLVSPLGEHPATGREVVLTGIDIFAVDEGRGCVTAIWAVADMAGLVQRIAAA